ncbi:winged helix-turn-helix domain-containing protein [Rhizobium sp. Root1220]|uniref:ATP-binding protein n=1 Tax=Rhizobium sp. Root1220 TaxID=1736432 RepID=UPI0006FE0A64|nr:winged helix-turn-helix domain-containing protein [Rhizobium sp. Root1220]KQV64629.1 hypothetical protein ASC90_17325 [Rhizobium sp. Root1220]
MASDSELEFGDSLFFGPFQLIAAERFLARDGVAVPIGGRALDILIALTRRPGEILSGDELTEIVWPGLTVEQSNLRVHMVSLRKALSAGQDGPRYILNVAGRGYTFTAPVHRMAVLPAQPSSVGSVPPRSQDLPPPLPFLVGRNETVDALALLTLSQRFVTVVGPGGIGKTTVAVAVANSLRQEFGDNAVYFVDLGLITDSRHVPNAVASALGCFVQGPDVEPYIVAFLADKRSLIVLDNCEHVITAVAALTERLFRSARAVHLLATSREAIRVEGENVHLLLPLDTPPNDFPSAAQALSSPAVKLFMEKAASSGYRVALTDREAPIVANICRRLDGIALAIELVASRVATYGIQGTFDLLGYDAELQLQGRRSALPRHQTLQGMLDWSFNLLSELEQEILSKLAVFVGQFTLEAAIAVAGSPDDKARTTTAIASLVDKSLVSTSPTKDAVTYRLLDTTRVYAAAKLAAGGEIDGVAMRHARYFADFLKAQETPGLVSHGHNAAGFTPHLGNIRQALAWSFSPAGNVCIGIELASHATPLFLASFPLLAECRDWCRQALDVLLPSDRGQQRELYLQKALALSSMYLWEDSKTVRVAIERGLELAEDLADARLQHYLLIGLSVFLTRRGETTGALAIAQRALAISEKSGGAAENAMSEWLLGASFHVAGNQLAATSHFERGFMLATDVAPSQFVYFGYDYHTRALASFAKSLWIRGSQNRAVSIARQANKRVEGSSHPVLYCAVLLDSVPVLYWSGKIEEASEYCENAIECAMRYSLSPYLAVGLALRGELMIATGAVDTGVATLRAALQATGENQNHVLTAPTQRALAEGLCQSGGVEEALLIVDDALYRAGQAGASLWLPDILRARGEIILAMSSPDLSEAESSLLRSVEKAREQNALSWELKAIASLSSIWRRIGRADEAKTLVNGLLSRCDGELKDKIQS